MLDLSSFPMVRQDGIAVEECRAALNRVLASDLFAGSRRLTDFCYYSGEAAIEGRSEIDQYEIAEKVLGRATDFNPWDDATVRKLATQVRHKLEEYYAGPGAADAVVVALPRRSYVLRFQRRDREALPPAVAVPPASGAPPAAEAPPIEAPPAPVPVAVPPAPAGRIAWLPLLGAFLLGALLVSSIFLILRARPAAPTGPRGGPSRIIIDTRRGDVRGKELDIAPEAVRLGPVLGEGEEAAVRLRFSPEFSTQQAGLMALYDPDHYVRVGQHFKNRPLLEFGFELEGAYQGPLSTYTFDPLGQTGQPRWFGLRRQGPEYSAFVSLDGFSWTPFGAKLTLPDTSGDLHSAVYAFNGRANDRSERAVFDHFGAGLAFHNRPAGAFDPAQFPVWTARASCKAPVAASISEGTLRVSFAADSVGCVWELTRPTPPLGDWAISVLADFEAVSGSSFGVVLRGSKSNTSLTRRDLDGRSLQLERNNDRDVRIPDFPGTPPVLLRLEKSGAEIHAAVSRDLETFTPLPATVPVAEIGELRQVGIVTAIAHWTSQESRPPARIYWIRIEPVTPPGLAGRNVP